jgi:hypothetical protein
LVFHLDVMSYASRDRMPIIVYVHIFIDVYI